MKRPKLDICAVSETKKAKEIANMKTTTYVCICCYINSAHSFSKTSLLSTFLLVCHLV